MMLNEMAAPYGLFQIVFADVVDHLAVGTFRSRERKEPGLVFEEVFKQEFSLTVDLLLLFAVFAFRRRRLPHGKAGGHGLCFVLTRNACPAWRRQCAAARRKYKLTSSAAD